MKNLIISALVAYIMHATNFIVDCSKFEYVFILISMAACCFSLLEWFDNELKIAKRKSSRPVVRRRKSIDFDMTRIA